MKLTRILGIVLMLAVVPTMAGEAKKKRKLSNPELAALDPDFKVQGEYVATIAGKGKVGVQVIADGNAKFTAVLHKGGLPGAGWDGSTKPEVKGQRQGERAVFGSETDGWIIQGDRLQKMAGGSAVATLNKVHRKSPTEGLKPLAGAVVLFDGTGVDMFEGGRLDEKLLADGTQSKRKFPGDHIIHIEFRLPYYPTRRGQGRGNSGMYMQAKYEIQMLDSFGLKGRDNECGGIYSVAPPKVNMCFPPLTWQTYDAVLTSARFDANGKKIANARMTAYHNGVLIQNDVEIKKTYTTAAPGPYSEDERLPGPLYLQAHGSPVRYRNIWIKELDGDTKLSLHEMVKRATKAGGSSSK